MSDEKTEFLVRSMILIFIFILQYDKYRKVGLIPIVEQTYTLYYLR